MPVDVNPRIDIVFRELFGRAGHEDMLVDLLNELLRPEVPLRSVQLRNPFVFPDVPDDRTVILDLEATDEAGVTYHIEMQTTAEANLRKRMMFVWSAVYRHQLAQGDGFWKLRPVISLWICERSVVTDAELAERAHPTPWHTRWVVQEEHLHRRFSDDFELHIIELDRFRRFAPRDPSTRWQQFIANAEGWAEVPPGLESPLLEKAMSVLDRINADQRDVYEARLNEERRRLGEQEALQEERRARLEERRAREAAEAAREAAEAAREASDARVRRLEALLRASGIVETPD
jgi:predicted transposase/invertase (TIGR01784 family)